MKNLRLVAILLRPSLLSFCASAVLAIALLLLANWTQVVKNPVLYEYFFGPTGVVTSLQNAPDSVTGFWRAVAGGSLTYNVVILVLAAVIGLLVYGFLEGLDRLAVNTNIAWRSMHARDEELRKEVTVKVSVRIVCLVIWLSYWMFFAKLVLPFCILAFRTGVDYPFTRMGTEYNLIGVGVLLLAFHVHVILLRFLTLRVRIFGAPPELYG